MYPNETVAPMRGELVNAGFQDLRTPQEVEQFIGKEGLAFLVVNSVCGCAGGVARPAAIQAMTAFKKELQVGAVFAGVDGEAVAKAREHMFPFPPSSPAMAVFKNGKLVHILERHQIEGRSAEEVAENLISAFEKNAE